MKYYSSTSALLFIGCFFFWSIFLFYLMAQKHAGNVIVEDIFKFNFYCMMLAMSPLLLKKAPPKNDVEMTIFEEKQHMEMRHQVLSQSAQERRKAYLMSAFFGFLMSSLMMSFILMLDK